MDLLSILTYFGANGGAALAGLLFWWTLENLQPIDHSKKRFEGVPLLIILTIFLTPLGALFISLVVRLRRLLNSVKHSGT